jgi:hypothetical protein
MKPMRPSNLTHPRCSSGVWVLGLALTGLLALYLASSQRPGRSALALDSPRPAGSVPADSGASARAALAGSALPGSEPDPASKQQVRAAYAQLPLGFEANQGQLDPAVKFLARGSGYSLWLTATEAVLALSRPSADPAEPPQPPQPGGSGPWCGSAWWGPTRRRR